MTRMVAQLTAAGLISAILWELIKLVMPSLVAIFFAVMAMLLKFALVMIVIFGVLAWIRKRGDYVPHDEDD